MGSSAIEGAWRSSAATAVRISGTLLQFLVGVFVARWAGVESAGLFFVATAVAQFFGIGAAFGYPTRILRDSALSESGSLVGRGIISGLVWCAVALGALGAVVGATGRPADGVRGAIAAGIIGGGALVCVKCLSSEKKGVGRPNTALALEFVVGPAVALVSIALAWVWGMPGRLAFWVVPFGLACAALLSLLSDPGSWSVTRFSARVWHRDLLENASFWLVGLGNGALASAPLMMAPIFLSQYDIGLLGAALRLVSVGGTALVGAAAVFAPRFAAATTAHSLRREYRHSQLASLLAYVPFAGIFLFAPTLLLGFFGPQFVAAGPILVLLGLLRLVNAAVGPAEFVLTMTGRQRQEVASAALSVFVLISLVVMTHGSGAMLGYAWIVGIAFVLRALVSFLFVIRTPTTIPAAWLSGEERQQAVHG